MTDCEKAPDKTPPTVSIVGKSGSGKTTLLVKLVGELKERGYRIAAIKHAFHGFQIDREGKDSWRLREAGADTVILAAENGLAMIKNDTRPTLDGLAAFCQDVDIIITEGFKRDRKPKIEVVRSARATQPMCGPADHLVALVTDCVSTVSVPVFGLEDIGALADFIESRFLGC